MFITLEGPDGSGKSTAVKKLADWLSTKNVDYILTREPGGNGVPEAEKIRELILDTNSNIGDMAEAFLYATSRRLNLEQVIWPALKDNKLVISDRYFDSSFAYQGFARGLGLENIIKLNEIATESTYPDWTIYFDISIEEAKKRVGNRAPQDRLELLGDEFIEKVHKGYKEVIKRFKNRFIVIDASKSPEEVFEQLKKVFEEKCQVK